MPRRQLEDPSTWHTHLLDLARTGSPDALRALTPGSEPARQVLTVHVRPGWRAAPLPRRRLPPGLPADLLPLI